MCFDISCLPSKGGENKKSAQKHYCCHVLKSTCLSPRPSLRPGSNMQNIPGILRKLLHKSAVAHGQNIQWNIPLYAAVCYVFVPFLMEYSENILQVRPHPNRRYCVLPWLVYWFGDNNFKLEFELILLLKDGTNQRLSGNIGFCVKSWWDLKVFYKVLNNV